jgi:hypothetical protein
LRGSEGIAKNARCFRLQLNIVVRIDEAQHRQRFLTDGHRFPGGTS